MTPLVKQPYPGMDTDGWITTPEHVVDHLLSDFFLSDYSQTENFPTQVASFVRLVQMHQADTGRLAQEVSSTLISYFLTYFYDAEVAVTWENEKDSINKQKLILSIQVTDGLGVLHDIVRIANQEGQKVTGIIAVINEG